MYKSCTVQDMHNTHLDKERLIDAVMSENGFRLSSNVVAVVLFLAKKNLLYQPKYT